MMNGGSVRGHHVTMTRGRANDMINLFYISALSSLVMVAESCIVVVDAAFARFTK